MPWQAFFFDFDGVLADSLEVKTSAFARLFEPFGMEVVNRVVDHHRRHGGMTRMDKFRYYYADFLRQPLDETGLADLCRRFSQLVVDEVVAAPEIQGAGAFVQANFERLPCFIISATPEPELQEIVQRRALARYFREVRGAPHTKTENLKLVLGKYGFAPDRCWFFGDAESDYRAATACGIRFLAIVPGPEAPLLRVAPGVPWHRNFLERFACLDE